MNEIKRKDFIRMSALGGLAAVAANPFKATASFKKVNLKKIGIIGLDTSHATAFVKAINGQSPEKEFAGFRFVAAYPKGSPDIKASVDRVPGYTEEVKKYGVEIVGSIEQLIEKVDYVCLETNDGRPHLQQALPVLKAGKPIFIDKPMTASLKDAIKIFEVAKRYNTPVFSSSSLRFITGMDEVLAGKVGKVIGAETYSPATLEKTHPDFFWYGIHGVEMLFTAMGPDIKTVSRVSSPDTDVVVGVWNDGRIGSVRGTRSGKPDYGGIVFGEKGNMLVGPFKSYTPLLKEIVKFFETGVPPVEEKETLAILAFMEAADESKRKNGTSIDIGSIFKKAGKK